MRTLFRCPRCRARLQHTTVDINEDTFRTLVVPNASRVTPADFTAATPVVVARLTGSDAAGEVFGKTKIKGGSRMGTWAADAVEVVWYPAEKRADLWWTMGGCSGLSY